MKRERVFKQEEREMLMEVYLKNKEVSGKTDRELSEYLGINPSTLYTWKNEDWFEDVKERVMYQKNAEVSVSAMSRLSRLINDEDPEISLKALNVFTRLNPDIELNKRPSGRGNNKVNVLESDMFLRMRMGSGDKDE